MSRPPRAPLSTLSATRALHTLRGPPSGPPPPPPPAFCDYFSRSSFSRPEDLSCVAARRPVFSPAHSNPFRCDPPAPRPPLLCQQPATSPTPHRNTTRNSSANFILLRETPRTPAVNFLLFALAPSENGALCAVGGRSVATFPPTRLCVNKIMKKKNKIKNQELGFIS